MPIRPHARDASLIRRGLPGLLGVAALLVSALGLAQGVAAQTQNDGLYPPLEVEVLDAANQRRGTAKVYMNYIELEDAAGQPHGAIGVLWDHGQYRLFYVNAGQDHGLIGTANNHRLYDREGTLKGYYFWTAIWSYVYDPEMKKVGQAQCLAYQGVCAAGVAGFLLGLE